MTSPSRATLASRIRRKEWTSLPGVFEMISARIADGMGFPGLYMTGYGTVASYLGIPDAGLATYTDMVDRVTQFGQVCKTPLICDGDTGYGGLLNVERTVRGYERAGAAGIQLEDQQFPKKCGHTPGRRVIPLEDAAAKIACAVQSRELEGLSDRRAHRRARRTRHRRSLEARRGLRQGGRRRHLHRIAAIAR